MICRCFTIVLCLQRNYITEIKQHFAKRTKWLCCYQETNTKLKHDITYETFDFKRPLDGASARRGFRAKRAFCIKKYRGDAYIPDFTNLMVREPSCLSPQVTELMKYDDHASAVSNTGTVTSTINLVHFTDKDFDFPVSLTYNSSGFRPRNPDNYVGRDWMLNAGGVVYRQVYGIPDDVKCKANDRDSNARHGFRKVLGRPLFNMQAMREEVEKNPYKYAQVEIEDGDTYARIPNIEEIIEPSPDVFYFSFGKHSGKFMINYDGSVSAVGFNGGKYEVDLFEMQMFTCVLFTDTYIRIKTDDGYVYTFGGGGYSSLEYKAFSWKGNNNCPTGKSTAPYEITAYHLTEITAAETAGRLPSITVMWI